MEWLDFSEVAFEELEPRRAVAGSDRFPEGWSGFLFTEFVFDLVEVGDEFDDSGGVALSGVEGFGEASSDVCHAASEVDDFGVITLVAGVDSVAVALKDARPVLRVFAEGLFEVFATAAFLPTVADAAILARVIKYPNVSSAGFSGAGGEFFDGRFVDLKVTFSKAFLVDRFGDGSQEFEAF